MDTSKFTSRRQGFPILDFVAVFAAKTDTSISFQLGRYGSTISVVDFEESMHLAPNAVFNVFGWADVQHPCHDHIKARMRVLLTSDLMVFDTQQEIIHCLFEALTIPRDETYEADFISPDDQASIHQPVDRNGMSDST